MLLSGNDHDKSDNGVLNGDRGTNDDRSAGAVALLHSFTTHITLHPTYTFDLPTYTLPNTCLLYINFSLLIVG